MGRIWILILLSLVSQAIFAQSDSFGLLPSLNFNKKLPKDWSVNVKSEFRQSLYEETYQYEYIRTDLSMLVGKKVGVHSSVAAGYQRIIETDSYRNRYIQQLNLISVLRKFTLGHRVSSDQTFSPERETEIRLRYRLSTEIPLNGASVDPKEFFLKVSNEYVNGFEPETYDLEIRWLLFLGYKLAPKTKLELGLDYRMDSFVSEELRNRAWLGLNVFHSL